MNAIPLLAEYREHPDDLYLLRVGYAGTMGALTDIGEDGFPAAAFHSFPDMLRPDPITGDYGPNFFGHAWNTATYVVNDPEFGWQVFGGNLKIDGKRVSVTPLDSARTRAYIAPFGLWLTLDSGTFESFEVNPHTGTVRIGLSSSTQFTPTARLRVEKPAQVSGVGSFRVKQQLNSERGAYVVPLSTTITWIDLTSAQ